MKNFSLLIKPASADCNLNCTYCFYLEKCSLYGESARHRMSDKVLEQVIESYLKTDQSVYSFGWQGGEPTLMGLPFFKKVVDLQMRHGKKGASVANGLQTNATLIDAEFASHLAKYHFLLGCSLDGPAELHDRYRTNHIGDPTHSNVIQGINHLNNAGVSYNILVLVSRANVAHAREIYRYLTNEGYYYHQYIPCVEFDKAGNPMPFSITGAEWGRFLCELFDEWYQKDTHKVSIRHFDALLSKIVDGVDNVCTLGKNCCQYFVVEYNGDVYPCDFFVDQQLKLGNIMTTSWSEMANSTLYRNFGVRKSKWNQFCEHCDCLDLCSGDCLKHRAYAGHPADHLSHLCEGWKQFIHHSRERLNILAGKIKDERDRDFRRSDPASNEIIRGKRVGRNALCPCGSGLKYKKCCGRSN
ncbi:MAG: anaerobic sulfatase maturase [Deltaproteobacteria bacterium]|jgi:uncharacterized protein|nr:anaerobic sulfatase maturase [Deltaproteobacteria bacterium]MBT4091134.1 anaerobic sulfatase maturase [Deltaproteobacteria bacterium]MBT4264807.1 anaerobic sulfatase maturase [Deltaproteobacteria bacterium]MBT4639775.1 anaerobic sulfatase maturase [Deltaproteobacteria bacterium]MBT6615990.1 anaerobic sulfatase maturase [Deltaproteobacteria bacterium]